MRHKNLLGLTLVSLALTSFSASAQRVYDIRRVFAASDDLTFRVSMKTDPVVEQVIYEAELCLTNKCDLFELRGENDLADFTTLLDFSLAYTLYASHYADFQAIRNGQSPLPPIDLIIEERQRGPELLDMYGNECLQDSEAERAECVLKSMVAEYGIRFYLVTYDRGLRSIDPRPTFMERVTSDWIAEQKRWISNFSRE